jgi:hypothetical protein
MLAANDSRFALAVRRGRRAFRLQVSSAIEQWKSQFLLAYEIFDKNVFRRAMFNPLCS